ncbi:MAG: prepilin-type N-terminal cleavage/methylation domain-containing protein [Rhodocyclales bacterium]|nr:prepilin-type N-terminal cleavage/methylation domain-containing protein [Rhodocyclales bacterium]
MSILLPTGSRARRRSRGFSLIELLIGLVISMMGLAAVATMMMNFSKKRTSITQTLASQDNGVMALYRLERDIGQAGYALLPLQGCATIVNGASASFAPYPVQITDGGTGSPDVITVRGANPASGIPGTELDASSGTSMTSNQYNVRSSLGFSVNDIVAATQTCTMTPINSVAATALGYSYTTSTLPTSSATGYLVYFGQAGEFTNRQYAIGPSALTVADYPAFVTNNLVDNIVFMKAQYGLAGSITGSPATVSRWVSGATTLDGSNCLGTSVHPNCVVAVRVGVVARSASAGPETVDQPSSFAVLPQILSGATEIGAAVTYSVTAANSTVRYRAYSTIIPLKNVIWGR